MRTWVFAIARNRCKKYQRDFWRRWWILSRHRDDIKGTLEPDPLDPQDEEVLARLRRCVKKLKPFDRALLMMYYFENLSFREMATHLRLSEATVRRRVHDAEAALKRGMTQEKGRR